MQEDGTVQMVDMDITCPMFQCSNSGDYDGSITAYKSFLTRTRPVGWRDEVAKQQNIGSKGGSDAMRSCRVKLVNMDTVLPSQVNILLFFVMQILKHRLYISNIAVLVISGPSNIGRRQERLLRPNEADKEADQSRSHQVANRSNCTIFQSFA